VKEKCWAYARVEGRAAVKSMKEATEASKTKDSGHEDIKIGCIRVGTATVETDGKYQLDTGTSHHTTRDFDRLINVIDMDIRVTAHDGTISRCNKKGILVFNHLGKTIRLPDILYAPSYLNLISLQRIIGAYQITVKSNNTAELSVGGEKQYELTRDGKGALWIEIDQEGYVGKTGSGNTAMELHKRYGHISFNLICFLPEFPKGTTIPYCEACEKGKATKPSARNHANLGIRTTRPLQQLHADLVVKIKPIMPRTQHKNLLNVTNDYSHYTANKILKLKSDAHDALIKIIDTFEAACPPH
jgi:hypothetical protein